MMIGHPTLEVPSWPFLDNPKDDDVVYSPFSSSRSDGGDFAAALRRYLPSNNQEMAEEDEEDGGVRDAADAPVDAYSCDHFRIYEFKVRRCTRGRSHDWTACPFAHPGEKARRRDPRKYHYTDAPCPEFRKGSCRKGEICEFSHGVFECWLHPARYRTQPCKDGMSCRRRVCFFAHKPEQLRVVTQQSSTDGGVDYYEVSPLKQAIEASCGRSLSFLGSPMSISADDSDSPPASPVKAQNRSPSDAVTAASPRSLQLGKVWSLPSSWTPRVGSTLQPSCFSLPATPTQMAECFGYSDLWENIWCEEEPVMERVESGRHLRARMFERLSKENPLELVRTDPEEPEVVVPDVGWVSELVM
ncbi:hypothetical protein SAY87_029166 [Trapa incisa]|uniref:C3H1-type domain-containing protein n=1 Tax=Trapa incisa TaxID=236973 RepID=A0AAN7KVE4_9MYRT|nr:hypothetical protein SAY87_029166 [Trapa incisa]